MSLTDNPLCASTLLALALCQGLPQARRRRICPLPLDRVRSWVVLGARETTLVLSSRRRARWWS